ncbi:MAG: murein biosynthesis integral membrane protein MurJ [Actinobacteria bacterium]|nr:murein biosynthesis integral membrane protein MurJ [Actinomycetota bacterium]
MATVAKSTAVMSTATIVSRITGFIRVAVLAYALGASRLADSYNLANVMPNMIYELIMGGILSSLFIPVFMEYLVKEDKNEAWYVASVVTNIALIFLTLMVIIGVIFPYPFVFTQTFLLPGKYIHLIKTVSFFFRFFIIQIIFYGFCAIFTGLLNSHKHFTIPAVAPVLNNTVVIIAVLFFYLPFYKSNPDFAVAALAVGTTLGVVSMALIQIPSLFKIGVRYKPVLDFSHPAVRKLGRLSIPVIIYVVLNQIGLSVAHNLAYKFKGGVTAVTYSFNFFQLPYGIFAVAIATALFPNLSEYASKKDFKKYRETFSLGIRSTSFIMILASVFFMVLSQPIIKLFLGHGQFDMTAVKLASSVLFYFASGLFFFAVYMFLIKSFYSLQDSKTPTLVNAIGVPFNITANLALVNYLGVSGLALGNTLTYVFTMIILFVLIKKRLGTVDGRRILFSILKFLIAGIFAGAAAWFVSKSITASTGVDTIAKQSTQIGLAFIASAGIYFLINYILAAEEIYVLKDIVNRFLKRGKPIVSEGGLFDGSDNRL